MGPIQPEERQGEPDLPATAKFVIGIGIIIVIGWLLMYHLTVVRW